MLECLRLRRLGKGSTEQKPRLPRTRCCPLVLVYVKVCSEAGSAKAAGTQWGCRRKKQSWCWPEQEVPWKPQKGAVPVLPTCQSSYRALWAVRRNPAGKGKSPSIVKQSPRETIALQMAQDSMKSRKRKSTNCFDYASLKHDFFTQLIDFWYVATSDYLETYVWKVARFLSILQILLWLPNLL